MRSAWMMAVSRRDAPVRVLALELDAPQVAVFGSGLVLDARELPLPVRLELVRVVGAANEDPVPVREGGWHHGVLLVAFGVAVLDLLLLGLDSRAPGSFPRQDPTFS